MLIITLSLEVLCLSLLLEVRLNVNPDYFFLYLDLLLANSVFYGIWVIVLVHFLIPDELVLIAGFALITLLTLYLAYPYLPYKSAEALIITYVWLFFGSWLIVSSANLPR